MEREPIFSGAIRALVKAIGVVLGVGIGVAVAMAGFAVVIGSDYLPPKATPTILPDAKGDRVVRGMGDPVILCVEFKGEIGTLDLTSEKMGNLLLDSQEDFLKGRVKGVLLYMDTPGGVATDSDTIYRMVKAYKEKYGVPVYAYVDGLCASGGMYIAFAADKIYASASSIIGSIGVVMGPAFNFSGAMGKYGIGALTIAAGKDKDELNAFRPWKADEGESLKVIAEALYDRFVSIAVAARPGLDRQKLVNEYGAHVFVAGEAEKLGYVDDGNSDYEHALGALVQAAHIEGGYQVVRLTPPRSLFGGLAKMVTPMFGWQGKFLYYYQP